MEGLTYNTAREKMVIPAYGRLVQQMLEKAKTLEGERQQALVERIVKMMLQQQASDNSMTAEDLERKLWQHAYRMANFELTALPPDGERPTPEADQVPPEEVPYPKSILKQRNYGMYVQKLIERAVSNPDTERKTALTNTIACYMKLAYSTYNDAQTISDRVILSDLKKMSDGMLELPEDADINAFMGKGTQSHIKQTAPTTRRRKRKKGGQRNRRRYRKR